MAASSPPRSLPILAAASTTKGLELRELTQLRQAASLAKVPAAVTEAEAALAESDSDKVVLFGCYRETIQRLHERLKRYGACLLTGAVTKAKREALVSRFTSGAARVFIATFEAGGVGCVPQASLWGHRPAPMRVPVTPVPPALRQHHPHRCVHRHPGGSAVDAGGRRAGGGPLPPPRPGTYSPQWQLGSPHPPTSPRARPAP